MLNGLGERAGRVIEQARAAGPFTSIEDFARRTKLGQPVIKRLAEADAFNSVGADRRQSLWHALAQEKKRREMPLFNAPSNSAIAGPPRGPEGSGPPGMAMNRSISTEKETTPQSLPPMQPYEQVVADYRTVGLSLRAHPISFYREQLERLDITPANRLVELADNSPVRVAGLVLLRQRPSTAKGITFVTLEDETGTMNLVVHQHMWDRYYRIARRSPAWLAHGQIQTAPQSEVPIIHVVVNRLEALTEQLHALNTKSRDFR
jgi:error-prone DNA polymerase